MRGFLTYLLATLAAVAAMVVAIETFNRDLAVIAGDPASRGESVRRILLGAGAVAILNLLLASPIWAASKFALGKIFGEFRSLWQLAALGAGVFVALYTGIAASVVLRGWPEPDPNVGLIVLEAFKVTAVAAAIAGVAWAAVFWLRRTRSVATSTPAEVFE